MKRIAIVCASGIGDALIVHSIAHLTKQQGWIPTTYTNHLQGLASWLPGFFFAPQPALDAIHETLSSYHAIFLQHDNSPKAFAIKALPIPIFTFYGAHLASKHGPLTERDYVCDRNKTMVENIALASEKFFGQKHFDNGLRPPCGLIYRRFPKRIAIHPTGSSNDKIWPRENFLAIASALKKQGYEPVFTVPDQERAMWDAPELKTLGNLAAFLYESGSFLGNDSGPGHLASFLQIPHLILGGDGTQMPLWQPGWRKGTVVSPSPCLMYFKAFRKQWKKLIRTKHVLKKLINNELKN